MARLAENVENDKKVVLDGNTVSSNQFNETLNNLSNNQRIVEVSEDKFETVSRMRG